MDKIKYKFYDKQRKWLMDVISIDASKGTLICSYGGQAWVSLIENGILYRYDDKNKNGIVVSNLDSQRSN
jgi:hypothetical protein